MVSTFARAVCNNEKMGKCIIFLCVDDANELRKVIGNVTYLFAKHDTPLADALMKAAASEKLPTHFHVLSTEYELTEYEAAVAERMFNKYRKNKVDAIETIAPASTIILYDRICRCPKCFRHSKYDSIINICGYIPLKNERKKRVPIDLQKCKNCNAYFINKQSLYIYESQYGPLSIEKKDISYASDLLDINETKYKKDSILSRNGYKPSDPTNERQRILIEIMEADEHNKEAIIDHLSYLIDDRGHRCHNAIISWLEDLQFVNDYKLSSQKKVKFY